jgi:hypothetical protein
LESVARSTTGTEEVQDKMEFIAPDIVCKSPDSRPGIGSDGPVTSNAGVLDGLEVRLPSSCSKCGCVTALIGAEAKRSSLRCASCRAHLGWVSETAERFLRKAVERFGRPTKPIEVHHNRDTELSPPPSGAAADDSHEIIAPEKLGK